MAKASHTELAEADSTEALATSAPAGSRPNHLSHSWHPSCALKVKYPADIIPIFQADDLDDAASAGPVTKFWTGSLADEEQLAQGQYVLVEVQNRLSLIFKHRNRNKSTEHADNPKLLIPIHTAERIGFSRLANVGPVVQKTASCTFTMRKVDSEEACKGSTALHFNNQIFKLDTTVHDTGARNEEDEASTVPRMSAWANIWELSKRSLRDLFSFRALLLMSLGRYGLGLANDEYRFFENDSVKHWIKDAYVIVADYIFRMQKPTTWYDSLWSRC